jgi:hypothetical protein
MDVVKGDKGSIALAPEVATLQRYQDVDDLAD